MADIEVKVTIKPPARGFALSDLKERIASLDLLIEQTDAAEDDVTVKLDTDYDDDSRIIVATWEL